MEHFEYKKLPGRFRDNINNHLIYASEIMKERLGLSNNSVLGRDYIINNCITLGDVITHTPNYEFFKISKIEEITGYVEKLINECHRYGHLVLSEKKYDEIPGKEFRRKDLQEGLLTEEEAVAHPIWNVLAEDITVKDLLNNYSSLVIENFKESKYIKGGMKRGMGFYLPEDHEKIFSMGPIRMDSLKNSSSITPENISCAYSKIVGF